MNRPRIDTQKNFEAGLLYAVLSAINVSFFALFVKESITDKPLIINVFFRFFFAFIVASPLFYYKRTHRVFANKLHIVSHVIRGFAVLLGQLCLFYYIHYHSLLNATLLWSTAPMFIPLIAFFYQKEPIHLSTLSSLLLGFLGVALIVSPNGTAFHYSDIIGIGAGFFTAVSQVIFGINARRLKYDENMFLFFLITGLIAFILIPIYYSFAPLYLSQHLAFELSNRELLFFSLIGVTSVVNQITRGEAYKRIKPHIVAPFFYLSIVFSALIEYYVFKTEPTLYQILGGCLIFSGSFIQWHNEKGGRNEA